VSVVTVSVSSGDADTPPHAAATSASAAASTSDDVLPVRTARSPLTRHVPLCTFPTVTVRFALQQEKREITRLTYVDPTLTDSVKQVY
jgi:hypothetical protein